MKDKVKYFRIGDLGIWYGYAEVEYEYYLVVEIISATSGRLIATYDNRDINDLVDLDTERPENRCQAVISGRNHV